MTCGAVAMRSLVELHEFIQEFRSVDALQEALSEIFASPEATDEEKRERGGEFGRYFKFAAEELHPLIEWLKLQRPGSLARVIDGNQHYDAEVRHIEKASIERIEIGRAVDGEQTHLMLKAVSQNGLASPNSVYKSIGKGTNKSVAVTKDRIVGSERETVDKALHWLSVLAKKKVTKNYPANIILVLFVEMDLSLCDVQLERFREGAGAILEVFLDFRPFCSLYKMDQYFI